MRLQGKKIAILVESDFYEPEIWYYQHRFAEEGAEAHFLTRLWGQPSLEFKGHELRAPFVCDESFEGLSDEEINKITHENAMAHFSYDPYVHLERSQCTVGALRARALDHDVSIHARGKRAGTLATKASDLAIARS